MTDPLSDFSDALSARAAAGRPLVATVRAGGAHVLSGIAWRGDLVVTSEQMLPETDGFGVELSEGRAAAALVGRDPGTNVALLRVERALPGAGEAVAGAARLGALALALGARDPAPPTVRLAAVRAVGPAWRSMAGGRIDQLIRLDMRAGRDEEGGPVLDARGGLIGMATAGPRGRALVIPFATVEQAVGRILAHGTVRGGWLGVGLQPVSVPAGLRAAAGQEAGLMVVSLAPGGPAEVAGVLPGDIVLALDGEPALRLRAIRGRLGADRVGQALPVRLMRAGAVQTLTLTVASRPAR
jgi:S1-C subfamily serine protease